MLSKKSVLLLGFTLLGFAAAEKTGLTSNGTASCDLKLSLLRDEFGQINKSHKDQKRADFFMTLAYKKISWSGCRGCKKTYKNNYA